jgi:hypothetical protein
MAVFEISATSGGTTVAQAAHTHTAIRFEKRVRVVEGKSRESSMRAEYTYRITHHNLSLTTSS